MAKLSIRKTTSVPASGIANTIYYVRVTGSPRADLFITDTSGTLFPVGIQNPAQVIQSQLAGFTPGSSTVISSSDSILEAFRKVQAQITSVASGAAGGIRVPVPFSASGNPNYPASQAGDSYLITAAGRIGGGSGELVQVGDKVVCRVSSGAGTQAQVGANFFILQANIDNATSTTAGSIRIATQAEANARTVGDAALTPAVFNGAFNSATLSGFSVGSNVGVAEGNTLAIAFGRVQGQINARIEAGEGNAQVRNNQQLDQRYAPFNHSHPVGSIELNGPRLVGRTAAGAGAAQEISLGTNMRFSGATLEAAWDETAW